MKNQRFQRLALYLLFLSLFSAFAQAANVAVSNFGYHPEQQKQVVVYTASTSGSFTIHNADDNAQAFSGSLAKPKDSTGSSTNCQGNQQCIVGDFSSFRQSGNFYVQAGADRSPTFKITSNVFSERVPLFMEVFEALRQQGSSYHANLHSVETPPFTAMADGSFIMATYQAAFAGIRMASAYNRNPQLFSFNKYQINTPNAPDLAEQIKLYVDFMKSMQDYDGALTVPNGYFYNFNCPLEYDPSQERYTTSKNTCLQFDSRPGVSNSAQALLLYAESIPAILTLEGQQAALALLERAKKTQQHIKNNYQLSDDNAAFYGAASFLLYDYTGDNSYLHEAHSQRDKVNRIFDMEITKGREFYWEEYARHRQAIISQGLQYEMNGVAPEQFFRSKIFTDWDIGNTPTPISKYGERLYILNENMDFQQSRFSLLEAVTAAKANELSSRDNTIQAVADSQFAWLTGMNQIQEGDFAGPLISRSFIFGIGNFPKNQHVRLVNPGFYNEGRSYKNGMKYIPGWIGGSFDSFNDGDKIFNYNDQYFDWRYTETTTEVMGAALELSAYLDAQYNSRPAITRPKLSGSITSCSYNGQTYFIGQQFQKDSCNTCTCNSDGAVSCTQNSCQTETQNPPASNTQAGSNCFNSLNSMPSTCSATMQEDRNDGSCRTLICSNGNDMAKIFACEKKDSSGNYLEMYRQAGSGNIQICIAGICIKNEGFKRSGYYPLCTQQSQQQDTTQNTNQETTQSTNQNTSQNTNTQPSNTNCANSVVDLQSTCAAGSISQDTKSGKCRTVSCSSSKGTMAILACDKPDIGQSQYFEMYRQSSSGVALEICLGSTCIINEGYKKSGNYPICSGSQTTATTCTPSTEICDGKDNNCNGQADENNVCSTTSQSVSLKIAPWYPKGREYVFQCIASGFSPAAYDWIFGDGNMQVNTPNKDVYVKYTSAGNYNVKCTARNSAVSKEGILNVNVV